MKDIDELIELSSVGEGLSWMGFGKHVAERRVRFGISLSQLERRTGMSHGRLTEIEGGCPDHPTRKEVAALEKAMDLEPGALESRTPRFRRTAN